MYVVVNVMLALMSVMIPSPGGEFMYFGCVFLRGELGFLDCADICMRVGNKKFELLEFVFDFVYVDLQ